MYRQAFPRCTVTGSIKPVPYSHFIRGAVPEKCDRCENLFEGGCVRAFDQVQDYLALDHGPCPVNGSTHPVHIEAAPYSSKIFVPAKCKTCQYLAFDAPRKFFFNFERDIWGDFPRSLDWTGWQPKYPNIGLRNYHAVSTEMMHAIATANEVNAIKIFRQEYPGASIREAREAYAELAEKLKSFQENKYEE